jgi:TolB-like protein
VTQSGLQRKVEGDKMAILKELKRRNVYRVGIAYVVIAWLIMQVTDVIIGNIAAPDWLFKGILMLLAIGFPLALFLAWAFELTPEGIKRDGEVDSAQSIAHTTGRKLDRVIIGVLAVAVVYFVADKWLDSDGQPVGDSSIVAIERSIAVLPFSNRSAVLEDAHFVDGIHDDILTRLANLSGLDKVISRTSTEQYRGTEKPILQIGQELGVATILEGGVQRAGNRVRINMQLINAATDEHLWAETYDRELTVDSLFEIQSEISREIVTALHAALTEEDKERLASRPTNNLEAYEQFVLGRQAMAKRTAEPLATALQHFEKAIELDASYALAYVGLADTITLQATYAGKTLQETFEPRQAAIDKALSLDLGSGEAYAALGFLRLQQGEADEAEASFLKAIELSPNYATAYHWYSDLLNTDDRREESLQMIRKALSLDPSAPVLVSYLSDRLRLLGRIEEAKTTLLDGIKLNPNFPAFHDSMSEILISQGRLGEAAVWLDRAKELNPSSWYTHFRVCHMLVELDDPGAAEECLAGMRADFPHFPELVFAIVETNILIVRDKTQAAVDVAVEAATASADPGLQMNLVRAYISNAEWEKSRPVLEILLPKFYADGEVVVSQSEIAGAISVAASLRDGDGWSERAHYLAGQALETMQTMHRTRGVGYSFLDVPAHTIRGDGPRANSALRDAIDSGWRTYWWMLRTPAYDSVNLGPEWRALIAELEADMAEQRRWYYEHRDDPLF